VAPLLLHGSGVESAIRYLEAEVARWQPENNCFSCHNNGDAVRALIAAQRNGHKINESVLKPTLDFLATPEKWDNLPGDPALGDRRLARLQFAGALLSAGHASQRVPEAARLVAEYQAPDGSWQIDADASAGSPVTYGPALATYFGRRLMLAAGRDAEAKKAGDWLRKHAPRSLVDAAAKVFALRDRSSADWIAARQNPAGNWLGEAFDTALAMLALREFGTEYKPKIEMGRHYLLRTQLSAGGWLGTTRPPGAQSYAQHISTTGWALLALVETAQ
jgi:squalene cyclase